MDSQTISTVASLVVGGVVLVILGFCGVVFWKAWKKGARGRAGGVSAEKGGRAQARPGKRRRK